MNAAVVSIASPDVPALITAERAAHDRFENVCWVTDIVVHEQEDREPTEADEAEWENASHAARLAMHAVLSAYPASPSELVDIVDHFVSHVGEPQEGQVRVLLATVRAFVKRADHALRNLDLEVARLRHRAEAAESRLASMGVRL